MRCGINRYWLLLVAVLTLGAGAASAQVTYELLPSTAETAYSGSGYVYNAYWHDCRCEQLYLASEMLAAGVPGAAPISAIAMKCSQIPGKTLENVRIRIKGTTATTLGAYQTSGYTQVYGPTSLATSAFAVGGWYTFTFSTPWSWNGTDNIIIDYTIDGTSYVSGGGCYMKTVSAARSNYGYADSSYTWDFAAMYSGTRTAVPSLRVTVDGLSVITPTNLPNAAVNIAYTSDIQASQGTQPYTWSFISGALPTGLTIAQVNVSGINRYRVSGTPPAGSGGNYSFTVRVTDGSSNTATKAMALYVAPQPAAMPFSDDFTTDRGWQLPAPWSRGAATAYSQASPACSEPGTDHTGTGNMIIGDYIGGKNTASDGNVYSATSPPVNCSTATNVRLRMWRWLGLAIGSTASIEVTNNGSTWVNVWTSTSGTTYGGSTTPVWTSVSYDISATAAGNATVQVRINIGPIGTTALTGWCIDDFMIEEPTSDMLVQETGVSGPVITDNQAVGSGRDFGQVNVSIQSAPLTIYITNNGPTDITFGTFAKIGAQPNDFYLNASALTNPLPPGASTSFTITFYRTTAGVSTATLEIPHNALYSGTSPFEINLRGEAIVPIPLIEVRLNTTTGTVVPHDTPAAGTQRDFGNRDTGAGPSASLTIVIINIGTGTLSIATPDMGGTWWTEYVVTSTGMSSALTAGQSTTFTVAFDPGTVGVKNAYVRIGHNDGSQASPYYVPVLGNGTAPGPTVNVTAGAGSVAHNAAAAGTTRDFGSQNINAGPTAALTITLNNSGSGSLTASTPVLGGADPGEFQLNTAAFVSPIAAAGSTSFTVAFDPTSIGQKNATITFTHNDAATTSPFIINVTGLGVTTAPTVIVRETSGAGTQLANPAPATGILNFGNRDINSGASAAATIFVENTGTASMTVGAPTFNPATTEFQLQAAGFAGTIPIGGSATFTITFDPTSLGAKAAVVEFTHNDPSTGSPFVLNVAGNGILNSPLVSVHEGSATGTSVASSQAAAAGGGRDLGSQDVTAGASAPITLFIVNSGTINLTLGNPVLAGPNAGSFVLNTAGFSNSVAPSGSTSFSVTFDPALGGIKDAQIEFTQDDATQPTPFIVMLRGTAVDATGVQVTTTSLTAGTAGFQYGPEQLNAVQGAAPYTWSLYSGSLPAGVNLTAGGILTGTPGGFGGVFSMVVRVTDQNGATDEQPLTLTVSSNLAGRGKAKGGGGCAAGQPGAAQVLALLACAAVMVAGRLRRRQTA